MFARRHAAVLMASAALCAGAFVATPAQAAPLAVCQWIDGEIESSYTCSAYADVVKTVELIECWKFPPAPRSYVRYKTSKGWVSGDMTLRIRGSKGCFDTHPYKTIVTVPTSMLGEMATTRIRLVMPAHSGVHDDSTSYDYGKTVVTYGACLVPEGTTDYCPAR